MPVYDPPFDFLEILSLVQRLLVNMRKVFCVYSDNTQKEFKLQKNTQRVLSAYGENGKGILPYSRNTPSDIELSLSWRIFDPNQVYCQFQILYKQFFSSSPYHSKNQTPEFRSYRHKEQHLLDLTGTLRTCCERHALPLSSCYSSWIEKTGCTE